jgi:hypothetical protein
MLTQKSDATATAVLPNAAITMSRDTVNSIRMIRSSLYAVL